MIRQVKLSVAETFAGKVFAMQRKMQASQGNWNTEIRYSSSWPEKETRELRGVLGELAFAKLLGVFWIPSVNSFCTEADVHGIEVRTTEHKSGHLPLREGDNPERYVALMTEDRMEFTYRGVILCSEGMSSVEAQPDNGKTLWMVPQEMLDSSEETLRVLRREAFGRYLERTLK